nr:MAG TPA: hypothetical protein [Bacteriophage sp.]DAU46321.1 MAG TPA: hypothetical protein [Bacteriophage sp.]
MIAGNFDRQGRSTDCPFSYDKHRRKGEHNDNI